MLTLTIGNKNYSSWSMRPWVLLKQSGIPFEEVMVRFDSFGGDSKFKQVVSQLSPAARVPILQDGALTVWDTLAIAEYLAEWAHDHVAGLSLWPQDRADRAHARSICAEMHSGFSALRSACPMNIEAHLPEAGAIAWRDKPAVQGDVARIVAMWSELLQAHPARGDDHFLFGKFSIADAYFAPVCMRIKGYALPVPAHISAYIERLSAAPGVQAWIQEALAEHDFVSEDEPYRASR